MTAISAPRERQQTKAQTTPMGKSVLSTKEKAKQELLQAIEDQNTAHGGWQKTIQDRYSEKVQKFEKKGNQKKEAEQLASRQIKRVWSKIFKDKLATPGTKSGDIYKDIGDSDGEGAIFLLKKFLFDKRNTTTEYLSHEQIESRAQSSDLKDTAMLKFFLDGGGIPGVTISSNEGMGLRSGWKQSRIVMDHHPEGPTSTTSMAAKTLEMIHLIPEREKETVQKFVQTIDIVDSFLSKAGRTIDVEKHYAKTLVALSYQLESEELYALCEKLPNDIGALTPLPDHLLATIEVHMKGKKEKVKLQECVKKKQANIDTGSKMVNEKITQKKYVTIDNKKILIFGPKDNISNDIRALLCAEHDLGTLKIHENGEIFMVHDQGIPNTLRTLGLTVRDVIFLLNPKVSGENHDKNKKIFLESFDNNTGKEYLHSFFPEKKIEEKSTPPSQIEQTKPTEQTNKEEKKEATSVNTIRSEIISSPSQKTKIIIPPFSSGIKEGIESYTTDIKGLWRSFRQKIRRKKK